MRSKTTFIFEDEALYKSFLAALGYLDFMESWQEGNNYIVEIDDALVWLDDKARNRLADWVEEHEVQEKRQAKRLPLFQLLLLPKIFSSTFSMRSLSKMRD